MRIEATSIDDYLTKIEPERAIELQAMREFIQKTVPDAEEKLFYGVPSFMINDQYFLSIAAQKHYLGFYICDFSIVDSFKEHFPKSNLGKSCLRFKKFEQIPSDVLKEIILEARKTLIN